MTAFWKYHGLGNDFVVVESSGPQLDEAFVRRVCDRRRGVGADGVLVVTEPPSRKAAARMVVYNRDGSRPEMCGNGIRCVARHLVETTDLDARSFGIATDDGIRECGVVSRGTDWTIAVDMGEAALGEGVSAEFDDGTFEFIRVDMGNPHAVTFDRPRTEVVDAIGAELNDGHARFPEGVNVEFVSPAADDTYSTLVYERGVGRTRACGTGACAVAVAAWTEGHSDPEATVGVDLPGGRLTIDRREGLIWMTGPIEAVFEGRLGPTFMDVG